MVVDDGCGEVCRWRQFTTYNIPGSEGLTLLTTADVHSWQFDVVAWDQKDSETTNLQNLNGDA